MKRGMAGWIACVLMTAVPAYGQTVITMRGTANMPEGRALTVADIALVSGDESGTVGTLVVAKKANELKGSREGEWVSVSVQELRSVLEEGKVNLGRTTLRGSVCAVRMSGEQGRVATKIHLRAEDGATHSNTKNEPTEVVFSGPATVRQSVAMAVAGHLNVDVDDVRIGFEAKDTGLLAQPVGTRRVDVQPAAGSANEVLPLRVYIYDGERVVVNEHMSVRVLVRRARVTAARTIERRGEIDESMLSRGEAWVPASALVGVTMEEAVGTVSRQRIGVGQVVTRGMIEQPVLVKKGDKVEVHCLSGTVTLKAMRARAMADGRDGEVIEFQIEGSKKSFSARVNGRGLAVMTMGGSGRVE